MFHSSWSTHALPVAPGLWHLRLRTGLRLTRDVRNWKLLHNGPHSRIYRVGAASPCIAKVIIPRSQPRDSLRKYGASQAQREMKGNGLLAAIGLETMPVYGWGTSASPLAGFESVLFMQPLPEFRSGLTIIRTEADADRRLGFLRTLAEELACMLGNGIIHRDAHFDNVCVTPDNTLIWIDNDLRRPATFGKQREGLNKMLGLLKKTARNDLAPDEWHFLTHALSNDLARWPQGERLAHEIP